MNNLPLEILDNVNHIITQYNLLPEKDVIVAFSGGKDSLFLCFVLRELGYVVKPITFDVGYNIDWKNAKKIAERFKFKLNILNIEYINEKNPHLLNVIENNFKEIQAVSSGKHERLTICTPCYNSKMLLLSEWCKNNDGIQQITLGHHGTDTVASFLKSYFMYIDRWSLQHITYNESNFIELLKEMKPIFKNEADTLKHTSEWIQMIELLRRGKIGTDEPIRRNIVNTDYTIMRPMFCVQERDIKDYFKGMDIEFQESECSVRKLKDTNKFTPREMVHYLLLDDMPQETLTLILSLILESLDSNGYNIVDVRKNRIEILGEEYKSGAFSSEKL